MGVMFARLRFDEFKSDPHDLTMVVGLYNALNGLYKYQQKTGV